MPIKKIVAAAAFLCLASLESTAQIITTPYFSSGTVASGASASTVTPVAISSTPVVEQMPPVHKPEDESARRLIGDGNRGYFRGEMPDAIAAYRKALKSNPNSVEAWLNGGVVLEEMHQEPKAVEWFRKALHLAPEDPKIHTALGWVEFRSRDFRSAEADFNAALEHNPNELYALLGLGRVELATQRANRAEYHLTEAVTLAPLNNLAHFWKAQALEAEGDTSGAIDAYKKAVINDSSFIEARYALGRVYMRRNWFHEAAAQFSKVLDADPENHKMKTLLQKVHALWNGRIYEHSSNIAPLTAPEIPDIPLPEPGNVPALRIGIGTNPMGRPLPHKALEFQCNTPFSILNSSGKELAAGRPNENWEARFAWRGKFPKIEILNFNGRRVLSTSKPVRIRPLVKERGITIIGEGHSGGKPSGRRLRGEVEFSLHPNHGAFKVVNVLDLESYTQGVLSAEMPIESPQEALKAQSVVARTNALYAMTVLRRHRKQGYDLCDGEHCQVYLGAMAESERSRSVVGATRGRIVAYRGKVAQVLYASNCGGHTQSGNDIPGWGDTPYWKGVADTPPGSPPQPSSPWELHWWLQTTPPAYCMSSHLVYPSHYRWTRVFSAKSLEEKFNRKLKLGKILGIRTLRRSDSGHLDAVLIMGTRKNIRIKDETRLRNLLGVGSLRSTLFVVDTEYAPNGRPETFVLHGGGWGHGVGMCQSGAMGRADQGQSYEDILKAYYPDTQLGSLRY